MMFALLRVSFVGMLMCLSLSLHASTPDTPLLERGHYVAQLGDCIACHTAKPGALMAGGLALSTPMGTIYSSNITPDAETGIGRYTFEQFDRVMREGVTPSGMNLYPAMPYPSYAKISEEDMRALYAYLMQGVPAVRQDNLPADMGFPVYLVLQKSLSYISLAAYHSKKKSPICFLSHSVKDNFPSLSINAETSKIRPLLVTLT